MRIVCRWCSHTGRGCIRFKLPPIPCVCAQCRGLDLISSLTICMFGMLRLRLQSTPACESLTLPHDFSATLKLMRIQLSDCVRCVYWHVLGVCVEIASMRQWVPEPSLKNSFVSRIWSSNYARCAGCPATPGRPRESTGDLYAHFRMYAPYS